MDQEIASVRFVQFLILIFFVFISRKKIYIKNIIYLKKKFCQTFSKFQLLNSEKMISKW